MVINGKLRTIILIASNDGRYIIDSLDILERQHNGIDIIGVTATQEVNMDNLPFIPLNEINLNREGYDVLLVAGARQIGMAEVTKFAKSINLDTDKLLGDWIVCIPGFTLQKYRQLQKSQLSIFAQLCFGGNLSNTLGLPFLSPFVNMFFKEDAYIRFLRSPRLYMEEKLIFKEMSCDSINLIAKKAKIMYPIFTLGNIDLHFNHYDKMDENIFNKRRHRINWYNLFVMAFTENQKILEQFDDLPYGKKVCFVPFKSDLDSAWYINREVRNDFTMFWQNVNDFAKGLPFYYDVFDMLLYGKKTPLIDM